MSLRWQYGTCWYGPFEPRDLWPLLGRRCRFTGRVERMCGNLWLPMRDDQDWHFDPYPGLRWWRRLKQWRAVVIEEALSSDHRPSLLKMLRAVLTGQVDRARWRARIRTCRKCPIYDGELRRCRGPYTGVVGVKPAGCGCYVPFLALTKEPYRGAHGTPRNGCWGRATMGGSFGWD